MQTSLVNLFPFVPLNCLEDCEVPSSTEVPSPHRLKTSTACAACLLVRVSRSRAALPGVATLRSDWPRGWLKSCLLIGRLKFWRKNLFSFLLTQTLSLFLSYQYNITILFVTATTRTTTTTWTTTTTSTNSLLLPLSPLLIYAVVTYSLRLAQGWLNERVCSNAAAAAAPADATFWGEKI